MREFELDIPTEIKHRFGGKVEALPETKVFLRSNTSMGLPEKFELNLSTFAEGGLK
jgi:hypothetical protein